MANIKTFITKSDALAEAGRIVYNGIVRVVNYQWEDESGKLVNGFAIQCIPSLPYLREDGSIA